MAMIQPVVSVQPSVVTTSVVQTGGREMWSSGLMDCCDDMGICCFGFWLPCVLPCQVSSDHGECLCLPLLEVLSRIVPFVALGLRISVRERYHIQGSICDDCCVATCCTRCVYCQLARELKQRRNRTFLTSTTVHVSANPPAYVPHYPAKDAYGQPQLLPQ